MHGLGEGPWRDAYLLPLLPKYRLLKEESPRRAGRVGANHLILNVAQRYNDSPLWGMDMRRLVDKSDICQSTVLGCRGYDREDTHCGLACWHLPDYILLVIRVQGYTSMVLDHNTLTRITRVADFLEWPSELCSDNSFELCSGGSDDIMKKLISEGRMKELHNIPDNWVNPDFVDLGDKRFLGEGVLMTTSGSYVFCKPDGWTGNLAEITIKELKGTVSLTSKWANSSFEMDSDWFKRGTRYCTYPLSVVHLGPGDILQVKEEPLLDNIRYMCRLKHRGGACTVLSGRYYVAESEDKIWAYDYINGTFADLDVPMGTWVATSETTMKRLEKSQGEKLYRSLTEVEIPDESDMMDVNDFPEFKTIEALRPYTNYESSCTDEKILETMFSRDGRHDHKGDLEGHNWSVKLETIGRFRVIAGMGPVPAMLRSKKYKNIQMEDFAHYLGGPILFSKDYPILLDTSYIRGFKYRSGRVVEIVSSELDMQSLVWVGVVDIEMEEAPLKYHSIEEACVDPPMTDDGRPYFEVKSGQLIASVAAGCKSPKVGNVAIGRWFFKIAKNGEGVSQLIAWHESVDDEPEFQAPKEIRIEKSEARSRGGIGECLSYDDQKVLRDKCMDLVDHVLEYGNVPMDVREYIGDYLVKHQDSPYWIDDGWMLHGAEMATREVGLFDPDKLGHLPFRTDMIIHMKSKRDPWLANIDTIPYGSVRGMPGGCIYKNFIRGYHSVELKFKSPESSEGHVKGQVPPPASLPSSSSSLLLPSDPGQVHAARIIINEKGMWRM